MSLPLKSIVAATALGLGGLLVVMAVPHKASSLPGTSFDAGRNAPAPVEKHASNAAKTEMPHAAAPVATISAVTQPAPAPSKVVVAPIKVGDEPLKPIPQVSEYFEDYLGIEMDANKIELGRRLFFDVRLSHDNTISCASCHDLRFGGTDRSSSAVGVAGHVGPINTPTVFNATLNVQQFWDGRAPDLEKQADGPPNAPGEMASNWKEITTKLLKDSEVVDLLRAAFKVEGELSPDTGSEHLLEAIGDFERTLITPGAPFDAYLMGDENAVSQEVKEGYQVFKNIGCIECHSGMGIGGGSFQRLGRKNAYFGPHSEGVDLGRYNVTKREEDKNVFKVPGLRNVALTGPWFHDASQTTLEDAVRTMARVQLDKTVSDEDVARMVAFLRSLTGTFQGRSVDLIGSAK
jgi:cytochrome c peroxidase